MNPPGTGRSLTIGDVFRLGLVRIADFLVLVPLYRFVIQGTGKKKTTID